MAYLAWVSLGQTQIIADLIGRRKVDTIDKLSITKNRFTISGNIQFIFSLQTVEFGVLQHRADQSLCKRHPVKMHHSSFRIGPDNPMDGRHCQHY